MTNAPQTDLHESTAVEHRSEAAREAPARSESPPRSESVSSPRRSWAWLGIAGWVAAAAMTVAVGTFWETILRLRHEIQIRDERVAELANRDARDQRWMSLLSASGARVAEVAPTSEAPAGFHGRAVHDPATRRTLVIFREAFPPEGHDYQLWTTRGGAPLDLGILRPDSAGVAVYRLENMGGAGVSDVFSVSLEPKGGSPVPTGPTVAQGSLSG
jgi:anti-sigma-K factor RskA